MAEEKKNHLDEEAVLLLNKGKKGLGRLIFGRTAVIICLLAAQVLLLFWGFLRLGEYLVYGGSLLLSLAVALVGPGHFTDSGHFILLHGAVPTGEVLVADPNSRKNSLALWDPQIILDEAKASSGDGVCIWLLG